MAEVEDVDVAMLEPREASSPPPDSNLDKSTRMDGCDVAVQGAQGFAAGAAADTTGGTGGDAVPIEVDPVEPNPPAALPFVRAAGDASDEEGLAEAFDAIVAQGSTTVKATLGVVGGAPKVTLQVVTGSPTIPAFGSLLELVDEEDAKYHVQHHGVCALWRKPFVRMLTLLTCACLLFQCVMCGLQVILSAASSPR